MIRYRPSIGTLKFAICSKFINRPDATLVASSPAEVNHEDRNPVGRSSPRHARGNG